MIKYNIALLLLLLGASSAQLQNVPYSWQYLNFSWPSPASHDTAILSGHYIPENNLITGIKVWKDQIYLTLPRWRNGVPATLAVLTDSQSDPSPLLTPYPSWSMQRLDDCSAFQYVQSMEIDPRGRMWILDNGRTEFLTDHPRTKCPPRLVILDLEDNGRLLMEYRFGREVARPESVFLNDIVLDHEDGGWAYITDTDNEFPGIIVFSLRDKTAWKVDHESMLPVKVASKFLVNGTTFETSAPVDGIALSSASTEGKRQVYYTPLSSYSLYSVAASALRSRELPTIDDYVSHVGLKSSQTDGMAIDAKGTLYLGALTENAVDAWNLRNSFKEYRVRIAQDDWANQWPDTFAIDEVGRLWWTSNRIQKFMTGSVDLTETNYRLWWVQIGAKSYQYYEDGTCPQIPDIY